MEVLAYLLLAVMFWGIAPIFGKLGLENISPIFSYLHKKFWDKHNPVNSACLYRGRFRGVWEMDRRSTGLIFAEGICAGLLGHFTYYYALKSGEVSYTVLLARSPPPL